MLNVAAVNMLGSKDIIFEIFAHAQKRRKEIGAENVFDFSLGNPSVPAPDAVKDAIFRIVSETDPLALHGYSPTGGIPEVRERLADDLNRRYRTAYKGRHIFLTCGAAAALAHALRAVSNPGDEILTFAPCFPEYIPYTAGAGCRLAVIPADTGNFQINFERFLAMLSPKTAAVLINSPNNPSGAVYSTETIKALSGILTEKSAEYGHPIYLISDEPYRDIVFSGVDSPYIANFYQNTLTCYSYSKSLSLPGERIGYVAVRPDCADADMLLSLFAQISRTIGHNGAPVLWQRVAAACCGLTSDISVYEKNRDILCDALSACGCHFVKPMGTFYLFPESPDKDAKAFCKRAMEQDVMLVPGDGFGCPGFFRLAFCVPENTVERSLTALKKILQHKQ